MPGDTASHTGPLITYLVKIWFEIYRVYNHSGCH